VKLAKLLTITLALFTSLYWSNSSGAEKAYIYDIIFVPLRATPGPSDPIVRDKKDRQVLVKSGTELTILSRKPENGFSKVSTPNNEIGWVPAQYIVNEPIARVRLDEAEDKIKLLEAQIKALQPGSTTPNSSKEPILINGEINPAPGSELEADNAKLHEELIRIRAISQNAIALNESNKELLEENEKLKVDIDVLKAENSRLQDNSNSEWFMIGAGAVGLGALIAIIVPWFKPRRKAADYW